MVSTARTSTVQVHCSWRNFLLLVWYFAWEMAKLAVFDFKLYSTGYCMSEQTTIDDSLIISEHLGGEVTAYSRIK